jgi:hypothetical protein
MDMKQNKIIQYPTFIDDTVEEYLKPIEYQDIITLPNKFSKTNKNGTVTCT